MALSFINKYDIIKSYKSEYNNRQFGYMMEVAASEYHIPIVCKYDQHDLLIKNGYKVIYDNYFGDKVYFKNLDINSIKIKIRNTFSISKYNYTDCSSYIDITTFDKYKYLGFFSTGYQTKCLHSIDSLKDLRTSFACELLKELLSERQIKNLNKKLKWFYSLQLANIKINCLKNLYGVIKPEREIIETYIKINKKE